MMLMILIGDSRSCGRKHLKKDIFAMTLDSTTAYIIDDVISVLCLTMNVGREFPPSFIQEGIIKSARENRRVLE